MLLAILAMSIGGVASAQTSSSSQNLNPGDQVRIVVWRKAEFSGDFAVAANGTIAHPLYR